MWIQSRADVKQKVWIQDGGMLVEDDDGGDGTGVLKTSDVVGGIRWENSINVLNNAWEGGNCNFKNVQSGPHDGNAPKGVSRVGLL